MIQKALDREAVKASEADERIKQADQRANELVKLSLQREEDRIKEAEAHYKDLMDQVIKKATDRELEFKKIVEQTKRRSRDIEDRANELLRVVLARDSQISHDVQSTKEELMSSSLERSNEMLQRFENKYLDALTKIRELEDKISDFDSDFERYEEKEPEIVPGMIGVLDDSGEIAVLTADEAT